MGPSPRLGPSPSWSEPPPRGFARRRRRRLPRGDDPAVLSRRPWRPRGGGAACTSENGFDEFGVSHGRRDAPRRVVGERLRAGGALCKKHGVGVVGFDLFELGARRRQFDTRRRAYRNESSSRCRRRADRDSCPVARALDAAAPHGRATFEVVLDAAAHGRAAFEVVRGRAAAPRPLLPGRRLRDRDPPGRAARQRAPPPLRAGARNADTRPREPERGVRLPAPGGRGHGAVARRGG